MPRWTEEAKRKQADQARKTQPWRHATGPRTAAGKARVSRNATRHGHRSREAVAFRRDVNDILRHGRVLLRRFRRHTDLRLNLMKSFDTAAKKSRNPTSKLDKRQLPSSPFVFCGAPCYQTLMSIELTTLPSGLRVITDHVPTVDSVALGVWADVGTRDEDRAHNGVAHMVEHMMFKGTGTRDAVRIAEEIEDVGGQMNAWTSREMTAYHVHLLQEHMPLALDVMADLLQNSTLPEDEIVRERQVIIQEIGMTADTPDDIVFDQYQETAYPDQSFGDPVLGRAEVVAGMTATTMRDYINRFYTNRGLVVSAAGNVKHDDFVARVEKTFSSLPDGPDIDHVPARYAAGEIRTEKQLEQSHIVLGFQGVNRHEPDYYAAVALSAILGGGMSSRLFQEVREKRGLAYAVFSFHAAYQDDGQFGIYTGTGPESLPDLIPVLCDEIRKICDHVKPEELARSKAQMRASMVMGRESMMTRAGQQAKQLINFGNVLDIGRKLGKVERVTVEDVQEVAKRIFASQPTLAALGPLGGLESYDSVRQRLAA